MFDSSQQIQLLNEPVVARMNLILHQKPHLYIIIPVEDEDYLTVSIITSKIEKCYKRYQSELNRQHALVDLKKSDLSILNKDSLVNCNVTELYTKRELLDLVGDSYEQKLVLKNSQEQEIVEKVLKAILISDIVKEATKEAVRKLLNV